MHRHGVFPPAGPGLTPFTSSDRTLGNLEEGSRRGTAPHCDGSVQCDRSVGIAGGRRGRWTLDWECRVPGSRFDVRELGERQGPC